MTRALGRRGGVATTAELEAAGWTQDLLRIAVEYGQIRRPRRGWYVSQEVSPAVATAVRIGGRLGCVSALAHHGIGGSLYPLHVAVAANTPRLRLDSEDVIVHWSGRLSGDRQAVSIREALSHAAACAGARGTL